MTESAEHPAPLPFWFALAVLGTWYGISLRGIATADPSTTSLPVLLLLGTLVAVSLFWMTEHVARVGGEARADAIRADGTWRSTRSPSTARNASNSTGPMSRKPS
jgi:hypothetical protein